MALPSHSQKGTAAFSRIVVQASSLRWRSARSTRCATRLHFDRKKRNNYPFAVVKSAAFVRDSLSFVTSAVAVRDTRSCCAASMTTTTRFMLSCQLSSAFGIPLHDDAAEYRRYHLADRAAAPQAVPQTRSAAAPLL